MRLLAPLVRLVRHAREWQDTRRANKALEARARMQHYDHGELPDESYNYWMTRIAREEANGTRKRDYEV